ncbi:PREDICTED: uncharacterized protein LOC109128823 [Camelina sativa]|uniref:Uncharacterized protein LOC109128823 n=1 Tax=Camelina sativa TaxID=90675 RepID=A0ABM1QXI4_CAMSA|nr:PREDICTED: uncharacterized protein LOC109128823 [Camelina sativa]
MSSIEKAVEVVGVEDGEWRQRRLGSKQGSVFPKERKLVKTIIMKNLFSSRSPLKSKQQVPELPRNKRV